MATAHAMPVPPAAKRILVADDQADVRTALRLLLKGHGYRVDVAHSPLEVLARMAESDYDAVLMDLNYARDTTSGREGLECLARLRALDPETPIVVMTAWGTLELAVEAMRRGASDFVLKPWSNPQLIEALTRLRRPEPTRARGVQRRLLPRTGPHLRTLEYAGLCHEAGPVGGDLYDFLPTDGGMALVVADACGKGVPAALLAAHLQGMMRSLCSRPIASLVDLLREINARFLESTAPQHYATLLFGRYDDASRRLTYVNCGHVPGVLVRGDRSAVRLTATAPPLGLFPDWSAEEAEQRLAPGDLLALVTDGVTEARRGDGQEFGGTHLLHALRRDGRRPIDSLARALVTASVSFAGGPPEDDLTVVVARALP